MIRNSKRRFSKFMVMVNCFLGWGAIYSAIWLGQAEWVAVSGFTFLSAIVGFYMHIGNKDLAKILAARGETDTSTYNGPAMPEPPKEE